MKSLVLYRKFYNTVHGCCIYTQDSDTKKRIEQFCAVGNAPLDKNAVDKYVVCEIDGDWRNYTTDTLVYLCQLYCERMEEENVK